MTCLQCNKPAIETNETYQKIRLRECEDGHRTGAASLAMIKKSETWKLSNSKKQEKNQQIYNLEERAA